MTKQAELAILDKAITALGTESYLGPYLASVRAEIERDITSDFMPMAILPRQAMQEALQIVADAKTRAEELISRTVAQCDQRLERQSQELKRQRERAANELQRAALALQY
jgi:hypothetical protein